MFPNTLLQTDVEDCCVFQFMDVLSVSYMRVVLVCFPQRTLVSLLSVTHVFEQVCTHVLFGALGGVIGVSFSTYTSGMFMSLLRIFGKACP